MKRTLIEETTKLIGERVRVCGFVDSVRSHGKIIFSDLRDISGILQLVFSPDSFKEKENMYNLAKDLRPEWVIEVKGKVLERPSKMVNPKIKTGRIELLVDELKVFSKAKTLPFSIETDGFEIKEEKRMKFRYLDLRRERMRKNLKIRNEVCLFIRNYLKNKGFIEIQTPLLGKSTPEGARDFLVPSRLHPGKFYALPQSPQQYKQLLMVSGFEKYFQIAPCFRDEDPRADRAAGEFYQIDIEMSFITQDEILELVENLFTEMIKTLFPEKFFTYTPWPRLKYDDVISKYKTDKPDLRKDKNNPNELCFLWVVDFPLFSPQKEEDFFYGSGKAKFAPSHHMFTAPKEEDIPLLDSDPLKVKSYQHDLILNGYEVGGGSIRIHDANIQEKIFNLIGFTKEQKEQFSHLLEAFKYGVPPHGGIAPGLDRLLMVLLNQPSLREMIAFPLTGEARDLMTGAPSKVTKEQLEELSIKIEKKNKK